jgi:hypothetical protein
MAIKLFDKIKKSVKKDTILDPHSDDELKRISVPSMEQRYQAGDIVGAALVLRTLLEAYGQGKKKNHRLKGREFIHFILSNKHKELKNLGYTHWKNINKVIHLNHTTTYPYHQENVRKAMDFFVKEIKGIRSIDIPA